MRISFKLARYKTMTGNSTRKAPDTNAYDTNPKAYNDWPIFSLKQLFKNNTIRC